MGERPAGIFERFSQPRLGLPQVSHRDTLLTSAHNTTVVTRGQLRFIPDTFKQPYLYAWVDNQDTCPINLRSRAPRLSDSGENGPKQQADKLAPEEPAADPNGSDLG